jgi:hypothetical protein
MSVLGVCGVRGRNDGERTGQIPDAVNIIVIRGDEANS